MFPLVWILLILGGMSTAASTVPTVPSTGTTDDRRISFWFGKYNMYNVDGVWTVDRTEGAPNTCTRFVYPSPDQCSLEYILPLALDTCRKWWPDTLFVDRQDPPELLTFYDVDEATQESMKDVYRCLLVAPPSNDDPVDYYNDMSYETSPPAVVPTYTPPTVTPTVQSTGWNSQTTYDRRISFWFGKYNMYDVDGVWTVDRTEGAPSPCTRFVYPSPDQCSLEYILPLALDTCRKWWPDTLSVDRQDPPELLTFYNVDEITSMSTKDVYRCLLVAPPSNNDDMPYGYADTATDDGFFPSSSCPGGSYNADLTKEKCLPCYAGTYAPANSIKCTTCAEGTYSGPWAEECEICPAGHFCSKGAAMIRICPAGTISHSGAGVCTPCGAGEFSYPGSSVCVSSTCSSA